MQKPYEVLIETYSGDTESSQRGQKLRCVNAGSPNATHDGGRQELNRGRDALRSVERLVRKLF